MLENYYTLNGSGRTAADLVDLLAVSGTDATSLSSSLSLTSMMSMVSAPSLEDFFFLPLWSSFLLRFMESSGFEVVVENVSTED